MEKYKFLEHTADVKFQAYGKNLKGAFSNAVKATARILTDNEVKCKITKNITVSGSDLKSLLYNFLEEILFLIDSESFLPARVKAIKISRVKGKYLLNSVIMGDRITNYETHGDIKAVTYNEMEIREEKGRACVQVVYDI